MSKIYCAYKNHVPSFWESEVEILNPREQGIYPVDKKDVYREGNEILPIDWDYHLESGMSFSRPSSIAEDERRGYHIPWQEKIVTNGILMDRK